jgi:VWFA-related protein
MKFRVIVCAALFLGVLALGRAQAPAASSPAAAPSDHRIALDVVVTDKTGKPVSDLQQQDFTILDDKQPKPIASFTAAGNTGKPDDPPLRVVFVIDTLNTSFRAMSNARQHLEKFLRQDGGHLPVLMSLVIFSEKNTQVQGMPTRDGNALADSVHAINAGAQRDIQGAEYADQVERIQVSLRALGKLTAYLGKQPGRKLLIWMSPGWPIIYGSRDKLSPEAQETNFRTIVNLSTDLRLGRTTLYSIDPLGTDDAGGLSAVFYENFLEGVPFAKKVESGDLSLRVIAVQSGGLVLNRNNDLAALIANCVDDSRAYYTLTFDSAPPDHPDEYHALQVKVNRPGLVARTRTGYYDQR